MKTIVSLTLLLLSYTLFAGDKFYPSIGVLNAHLEYNGTDGKGHVEKAKYKVTKMVEIQHDRLDFVVTTPEKKIIFNDVENSVTIDTGFDLNFLNGANLTIESAFFDAKEANFRSEEGEILLKKQRIRYKKLRGDADFKLIKRSVNELPISNANIYFSNLNLRMSKAVKKVIEELVAEEKSLSFLKKYLDAEYYYLFNGGIHLKNGHFWGSAWLDKLINIKIKFDTQVSLQDNDKLLVIDVKKIKASLVSVKGKVLKAIKDAAIKNVKVEGDKILISL